MVLNGCRLGFYEPVRKGVTTAIFKDGNVQSLGVNIFSGASSGILGAAAGSPFFLVKTRLQSFSPFLPVGTQHGYNNSIDGLRKINQREGVKGLYRGVGAAMVRTGFGSSVQLPTYFFAKRRLVRHFGMEEGLPLHIASSTASGFVVCCVMHPPGNFFTFETIIEEGAWLMYGFRYGYVEDVQSDRQPIQQRVRLLPQNAENRGRTSHLQGLYSTLGKNITSYDIDPNVGGAD